MRREPSDTAIVDRPDVTGQAVEWHVRAHSGLLTPDEQRALADWLAADPANSRAFQEIDGLWRDASGLEEDPVSRRVRVPLRRGPRRIGPHLAAAAAVALLLVVAAAGLWRSGYGSMLLHDEVTGVGERLAVQLPDGSALWLDARSAVDVEIDALGRRVALRRGRMFVRVAPDAARPFVVTAGDATVTALGTAFAVDRRDGGEVAVAVAEHGVQLRWRDSDLLRLSAGRQVAVDRDGRAGPVARVDMRAVAAWRQGRLVSEGQSLGAVLAALSDYRMLPILVADDTLAALPVNAVLDLDDTDAALAALAAVLPIRVRSAGPLLTAVVSAGR